MAKKNSSQLLRTTSIQRFPKDGTVKSADQIDWTGDYFNRTAADKGFYVWFGMWKGPFDDAKSARSAYKEWAWESKHS